MSGGAGWAGRLGRAGGLGRVAVTGAGGRLGRALVETLGGALAWRRPDYDLDDPDAAGRLVVRDRPDLVIHAAAWTDVDGCAREPQVALRRNGVAVGELADACRDAGAGLLLVSTNEVFDGARTDGLGYRPDDDPNPINPYGASKFAGECAALGAFSGRGGGEGGGGRGGRGGGRLWIVRTAWLYGPPGDDFVAKILAAADRLAVGEPLPVVDDEVGSPTFAPDLAAGIVALAGSATPGTYHLVNAGRASRYAWATRVLARLRPERRLRPIGRGEFRRLSTPPAWAVLEPSGVALRPWEAALDDYLDSLAAR